MRNVQCAMNNELCVAIGKGNSDSKSNLVVKVPSKSHILPVSVKPAIMSVSHFCVSFALSKYNEAMALKNPGFKFYSCKSNSVTNSVSQRSFCHLRFLSLLLLNYSSQFLQQIAIISLTRFLQSLNLMIQSLLVRFLKHLSYLSLLHLKTSKRLSQSSTPACQSSFSLIRRCLSLPPNF